MFAHVLAQSERLAFVQLLTYLALADGEISEAENRAIRQTCAELGLNDGPCSDRLDLDSGEPLLLEDVVGAFVSPESRKVVVLEMLRMALDDGECDPREQSLVEEIAGSLGVTAETVASMRAWVDASHRLREEGLALVRGPGGVEEPGGRGFERLLGLFREFREARPQE
jgi:uncharacterized tellurite resistance protein B-like protein